MLHIFGLEIDLTKLVNPLIYIAIAIVLYFLFGKILKLFLGRRNRRKILSEQQANRMETVYVMLMSIMKYIAILGVLLAVLANFGVNVTSILAGIGVITVILGLAFQDMMKDIIAGISIITEDQFGVGDLLEVDGFKGTVISVGLKTTQIKNYRGKVKIISNRNLNNLVNYSKFDTLAEVVVNASYENDPDKVMEALNKMKKKLDGTIGEMTGEIEIYPVTDLAESGVSYRINCPCKPYQHFGVQRAIRKEILREFKESKLTIPYPHIVVKEKQ